MTKWLSYLLAGITASILYLSGEYYLTALGIGLLIFSLLDFTNKIGKTIPILETMLVIACLQWILGPYIDYNSTYQHYKYYMYVNEEEYMNLVVPSLFLFAIPTYYFSNKINYIAFLNRIQYIGLTNKTAVYLIITGFIADVTGRFVPSFLGFIFFLLSTVKFVGVLFLFYSKSKYRWLALGVLFFAQIVFSVAAGMFHSLLLWMVLMFIFISVGLKLSYFQKLLILVVGFWFTFILQTVKVEYRKITWQEGFSGNKLQVFIDAFVNKANEFFFIDSKIENREEDDEVAGVNNRLNQGWIVSKIMDHIPSEESFLGGFTIRDAILSSFYLSAFAENKVVGGGKETYQRLTGFTLSSSTSMGTGIIGEAYGNFGVEGTYLFMLLWGLFIGLFLLFLFKKSDVYYTLPLWIPIIFLQVVKAETDFYTVFNHLLKSTILVFAILYFIRRKYKIAV
ncbi:MAG: hypothetical protein LC122_07300 [Chitinophagales bacterium]|nr:hypothetical protein [Chitinophagales bacterium]